MKDLLEKLNYKGQERIAVINAEKSFTALLNCMYKNVTIDEEIDPRYPYDFMILFAKLLSEVELLVPAAIHNLMADGILWICYPKNPPSQGNSGLDREHGWDSLRNSGFQNIRFVNIDENWSAIRFRNIKYIK